MSILFGPVVQQGYVVPDSDKAISHWLSRGVGPFFVEVIDQMDAMVWGETVKVDLTAAFAYSGDQQIEVIEPRGSTPSIYTTYLDKYADGGLQHLAVWVDDIDAKVAELKDKGLNYSVQQRYGASHAYLDNDDEPGVMIQLMTHNEAIDAMFDMIKEASETWDGQTDPVRRIDWSTGWPVIVDGSDKA